MATQATDYVTAEGLAKVMGDSGGSEWVTIYNESGDETVVVNNYKQYSAVMVVSFNGSRFFTSTLPVEFLNSQPVGSGAYYGDSTTDYIWCTHQTSNLTLTAEIGLIVRVYGIK